MTRRVIDLDDDAILQQTARALWEHDQKGVPAQTDWERIDPMERCDYRDAVNAVLAVLAEVGAPAFMERADKIGEIPSRHGNHKRWATLWEAAP